MTHRDLLRFKRSQKAAKQRAAEIERENKYELYPVGYEIFFDNYPYDAGETLIQEPVITYENDPELMAYVDEILGMEE